MANSQNFSPSHLASCIKKAREWLEILWDDGNRVSFFFSEDNLYSFICVLHVFYSCIKPELFTWEINKKIRSIKRGQKEKMRKPDYDVVNVYIQTVISPPKLG